MEPGHALESPQVHVDLRGVPRGRRNGRRWRASAANGDRQCLDVESDVWEDKRIICAYFLRDSGRLARIAFESVLVSNGGDDVDVLMFKNGASVHERLEVSESRD